MRWCKRVKKNIINDIVKVGLEGYFFEIEIALVVDDWSEDRKQCVLVGGIRIIGRAKYTSHLRIWFSAVA